MEAEPMRFSMDHLSGRATVQALLLFVAPWVAGPTEAQVRVLPMVGLYAPLSDLGEVAANGGGGLIDAGRRRSTLAVGLGLELGGEESTLGVRGRVDYGTSASVPIGGVGCPDCELRSTLLGGTVDLIFRPLPSLVVMRPFLVVGGGVKRYGFEREDLEREGFREAFRSQTRPSLRAGVGTALFLGPLRPRVEASVLVSRFETAPETASGGGEDRLQSDLLVMVSLPFGGP
jgi:hypothetical protein